MGKKTMPTIFLILLFGLQHRLEPHAVYQRIVDERCLIKGKQFLNISYIGKCSFCNACFKKRGEKKCFVDYEHYLKIIDEFEILENSEV